VWLTWKSALREAQIRRVEFHLDRVVRMTASRPETLTLSMTLHHNAS
jgi:hypothetical protein